MGIGIARLSSAMGAEVTSLDFARPLEAEHPERTIALVWRKGSPREKEFRLLADALRAAAAEQHLVRTGPKERALENFEIA